eukprot:gene1387-258_t
MDERPPPGAVVQQPHQLVPAQAATGRSSNILRFMMIEAANVQAPGCLAQLFCKVTMSGHEYQTKGKRVTMDGKYQWSEAHEFPVSCPEERLKIALFQAAKEKMSNGDDSDDDPFSDDDNSETCIGHTFLDIGQKNQKGENVDIPIYDNPDLFTFATGKGLKSDRYAKGKTGNVTLSWKFESNVDMPPLIPSRTLAETEGEMVMDIRKARNLDIRSQGAPQVKIEVSSEAPMSHPDKPETRRKYPTRTQSPNEQPGSRTLQQKPQRNTAKSQIGDWNLEYPDTDARLKLFRSFDGNGSGALSKAELDLAVIRQWPKFNHKPAIHAAYKSADINGTGWVEFKEFKRFLEMIWHYNEIWKKFAKLDTDGSRRLDFEEFRGANKSLTLNIGENDLLNTFQKLDTDNGGFVRFAEFCAYFAAEKSGLQLNMESIKENRLPEKAPRAESRSRSNTPKRAVGAMKPLAETNPNKPQTRAQSSSNIRSTPDPNPTYATVGKPSCGKSAQKPISTRSTSPN